MAPTGAPTTKPVFKTSTPFTETKWPTITAADQQIIVELVCNILSPLGEYRKTHIQPSQGKRSRKRKRKEESKNDASVKPKDSTRSNEESTVPTPAIQQHILVGINSITRHLETLVASNAPASSLVATALRDGPSNGQNEERSEDRDRDQKQNEPDSLQPLSMVFIPHPNPSLSPVHAHLPTLVHLSGIATQQPTLLIPLPTSTSSTLSTALHIPRVSAVAFLAGAPGSKSLEEFVREKVGPTECAWIDEAAKGEWKGINIK